MSQAARPIGLGLIILALVYPCVSAGGQLAWFINYPSLVIVLGLSFGACLAAFGGAGPAAVLRGLRMLVLGPRREDLVDGTEEILRGMIRYTFASGVVGLLVGLILILQQMESPPAIGPGIAVAILTLLYAAILNGLVYWPILHGIRHARTPASDEMHTGALETS